MRCASADVRRLDHAQLPVSSFLIAVSHTHALLRAWPAHRQIVPACSFDIFAVVDVSETACLNVPSVLRDVLEERGAAAWGDEGARRLALCSCN